jgi:hypothetical protein
MKKYKSNWILSTSIFLFLLFCLLMMLFRQEDFNNSRMTIKVSFFVFSFFAVIIAPILEEIIFRGIFTTNNYLKKTSIVFSIFIGLILFYINYNIASTIFLLTLILLNFYIYKNTNLTFYQEYLLVISNAFLFGFVHYKISDFESINNSIFVLSQISIGFLLIWITKNFGLVKSMIVHSLFNFSLVLLTFFSIQFVDTKTYSKENKNVIIKWSQRPFLSSNKGSIENQEAKIVIKNLDISTAINLTNKRSSLRSNIPFLKYNITIISKNKKISDKEIIEALEMSKLIYIDNEK